MKRLVCPAVAFSLAVMGCAYPEPAYDDVTFDGDANTTARDATAYPAPVATVVGDDETSDERILISVYDVFGVLNPEAGNVITSHSPSGGSGDVLWKTDPIVGVVFPARWTVSPDGEFASYWTMRRPEVPVGGEIALDEQPFELVIRGLVPEADPFIATRSPIAGFMQFGTVWSEASDAVWYAVPELDPPFSDLKTGERPSVSSVTLRRIGLELNDGAIESAEDALIGTLDVGSHISERLQLVAVSETLRKAVVLAATGDPTESDTVGAHLLVFDIDDLSVVTDVPLYDAGGFPRASAATNGRSVAVVDYGGSSGRGHAVLFDVESLAIEDILPVVDERPNGAAVWSHDGRWLAWPVGAPDAWPIGARDGWRVVGIGDGTDEALFVPFPSTGDGGGFGYTDNVGEIHDHTLVALAPDRPTLLVHSGVIGKNDGSGGQAREYRTIDAQTGSVRVIEGLPLGGARFHAWLP